MDQSCCHNEQRNAPGYFPGWLDTTTLLLSQEEHTDFSLFAGTFGSHGIWSRGRSSISSCDCRWLQFYAWKKCTWVHLPLPYKGNFAKMSAFSESTGACLLMLQSHQTVILPTQDNNWYGRSSHRTLFPGLFSKGTVQNVLGVSAQIWSCGERFLWT